MATVQPDTSMPQNAPKSNAPKSNAPNSTNSPTPTAAVDKFNRYRDERLKLESDFERLRKELSAIRDKLKEGPEEEKDEKKEGTPVAPTKTLFILFATAFALSRLINQKLLNKPTAIQFNTYFEIFKKLIKNYEFILKLGSIIAFPIGKPEEKPTEEKPTEEKPQTGGAAPKPAATIKPAKDTSAATIKPTAAKPEDTSAATIESTAAKDPSADSAEPTPPPDYLDETLFVQQLRSFHAHLVFSLNEKLNNILQNTTSETFKTDALTADENKRFASKEFTNTLDTLFTHMNIGYETMNRDFQAKLNTSPMQKYEEEVKEFNESAFNFNTLESQPLPKERTEEVLQGVALEQAVALKAIMTEGPVKVTIEQVGEVAMEIGEAAKDIQTSLLAHMAPDAASLGLPESIDAWIAAYTAAKGEDETIVKKLQLVKEKIQASKELQQLTSTEKGKEGEKKEEKEGEKKEEKEGEKKEEKEGEKSSVSDKIQGAIDIKSNVSDIKDSATETGGQIAEQFNTMAEGIANITPVETSIDKLKGDITSAISSVSAEANKAAAAAASIVSAAKDNAPELAAKAAAVKKTIDDALAKVQNASSKEAQQIVAALSKTITEGASTLSTLTKDAKSFVTGLQAEAAAKLISSITSAASKAVDIAHIAAGAVKGITSKLGPMLHTAAVALGATSLAALAASPALPIVAAVASIVMIIMHQKKLHSALVAKMKGYFVILLQMLEIFKIMSVIGSKMSYKIDDGACIHALNEFKAYLYLSAGPDLRKAIETAGMNKNNTGKDVKLSWFQKAMSKAQRIFSSSSIISNLDTLFGDIITFFLLSLSKFNIITSIHSDVLQSMKAEIVKLDEIVQFFNKVRVEPVKKCDTELNCQTDQELDASMTKYQAEYDGAIERAGVNKADVVKVLVKSNQEVTLVEKKVKKSGGGTKRFGRPIGKKRTKRKM